MSKKIKNKPPKHSLIQPTIAQELAAELEWFTMVLDTRLKLYFNLESDVLHILDIQPPDLSASDSLYARVLRENNCGFEERVAIALSLTPHLRPQLLDVFYTKNKTFDRPFTEFGGLGQSKHGGFLPTGETLLFILAGSDLATRLEAMHRFSAEHPLFNNRLLLWSEPEIGSPRHTALLQISPEALSSLVLGKIYNPEFSIDFPARRLETAQTWADLVLHPATFKQLSEIKSWCQHGHRLLHEWGMSAKLRPGYRCLFYGPSGTGKTLTATLLGQDTHRPVFRIDLSMVISKYIGETEKNLSRIFDQAEQRNWILFFDEADALFGKRTDTQNAHDRYANQEVSYLLQRIETFDGIAILASNRRHNLDDAFLRRFESVIYFPIPRPEERLRLWEQSFPPKAPLEEGLDLPTLAQKYELTGGGIMNVVRFAALRALENGGVISCAAVQEGVNVELGKEGRS